MSTIRFSAEELGNVAGFLVSHPTDLESVSKMLAFYSVANTAEYNDRYGEHLSPVSQDQIERSASVLNFNRKQAIGTLQLLRYNADSSLMDDAEDRLASEMNMADLLERAFYRVTES